MRREMILCGWQVLAFIYKPAAPGLGGMCVLTYKLAWAWICVSSYVYSRVRLLCHAKYELWLNRRTYFIINVAAVNPDWR